MAKPPAARHPPAGDVPARSGRHLSVPVSSALLAVMAHLTDRDLAIVDWLDRHGVLTTEQITTAFFRATSTAVHRLLKLRALGVVDRFHRPRPGGGFGPWHWVVGAVGAQLAAAARGQSPPTARALGERHGRLARNPQLGHHVAANQFFVDLHAHARRHTGAQLRLWWSAYEAAARYHRRIHPDGHALWRQTTTAGDLTVGLFLEYDTGTERPLRRVIDKLEAYEALAADGGPAYPVLFVLPTQVREQRLHTALAGRPAGLVPVATTVWAPLSAADPAGPVWALAGDPHPRRRLVELPCGHGRRDSVYNAHARDQDLDLDFES